MQRIIRTRIFLINSSNYNFSESHVVRVIFYPHKNFCFTFQNKLMNHNSEVNVKIISSLKYRKAIPI